MSLYLTADSNSNVSAYFLNNENNKSTQSRYYFLGLSGYTILSGYTVLEHIKGNNYSGKNVQIDMNNSTAVAIKIK